MRKFVWTNSDAALTQSTGTHSSYIYELSSSFVDVCFYFSTAMHIMSHIKSIFHMHSVCDWMSRVCGYCCFFFGTVYARSITAENETTEKIGKKINILKLESSCAVLCEKLCMQGIFMLYAREREKQWKWTKWRRFPKNSPTKKQQRIHFIGIIHLNLNRFQFMEGKMSTRWCEWAA